MTDSREMIDRRRALRTITIVPSALVFAGCSKSTAADRSQIPGHKAHAPEQAIVVDQPACILTPQSDNGPYYRDARLVRNSIVEDRPGVPVTLDIRLMDAVHCIPIRGARVDIWHADARGAYSGYTGQGDDRTSTVGQTYLRGTQMSDAQGLISFQTIYPGWYEGRAPHVHAKVIIAGRGVMSCQLFLPDALNEYIYTNVPDYTQRKQARDTINWNDPLIRHDDPEHRAFFAIREAPDRYVASVVLGIDPAAPPPQEGLPPFGVIIGHALGLNLGPTAPKGTTRVSLLVPGLR